MRPTAAGWLLVVALLPGCCLFGSDGGDRIVELRRGTPEQAFALFRAAMRADRPGILYEGLSRGFKKRYGIPSLREFVTAYRAHRSDFDDLADLLYRAEVKRLRYNTKSGRRYAVLTIGALGREADLRLVDRPAWEAEISIPGDSPLRTMRFLSGTDFSEALSVAEGKIVVRPLDASDTGVASASQVRRLSFDHHWLLEDVARLPVDMRALVERMTVTPAEP